MRIAVSADWHISAETLEKSKISIDWFCESVKKLKVNYVVICGDMFDRPVIGGKTITTGEIINYLTNIIEDLSKAGIETIILSGNHDQGRIGQKSSIYALRGTSAKIYDKSTILRKENVSFVIIPWGSEKISGDNKINLLFAHAEVIGAKENEFSTCKGENFNLDKSYINSFDYVGLGHIHIRQKNYIGTLYRLNFGNRSAGAGYDLVEVKDNVEVTYIENPVTDSFSKIKIKSKKDLEKIKKQDRNWVVICDDSILSDDIPDFVERVEYEYSSKIEEDEIENYEYDGDRTDWIDLYDWYCDRQADEYEKEILKNILKGENI